HLVEWTMPESGHAEIRDHSVLWRTAYLTLLFMFGFAWAVSVQFLLRKLKRTSVQYPISNSHPAIQTNSLLALAACSTGIWVALVLFSLNIGIQGQTPAITLPFKLAG